jgi:hypothetical protein
MESFHALIIAISRSPTRGYKAHLSQNNKRLSSHSCNMAFVAILVGVVMGSAITLALVYLTVFSRKVNSQQDTIVVEPVTLRSLDDPSTSIKSSAYSAAISGAHQGDGLLSGIMAQLWSHMNLAIAKSVKETVEPMFKEMLPLPLSSLHFTKIDLGTVPIRMDNVSKTRMWDSVGIIYAFVTHKSTCFALVDRLLFMRKRTMRSNLILMYTGMETATFLSRQITLHLLDA